MAKAIHSMIRVRDENRSLAFYEKAFGLKIAGRYEFDSFILIYLSNGEGDFELELTINKGVEAVFDHGNGYGHFAVSVDDAQAEHQRLFDLGLNPGDVKTMPFEGKDFATFFFISDPDGYKIEVLQRGGRFL